MTKLDYLHRTLDDEIVQDGLCAVNALEDRSISRGSSFLVGGIATQSYLPSTCRRPTADIDIAVLRALSSREDFKEFFASAMEFLMDQGYDVNFSKERQTFKIYFDKPALFDGGAYLEFPRRNEKNFQKRAKRLDREFDNARIKTIEGRSDTIRVASPEDIIVPKIVRGVGALSRNPSLCKFVYDNKPLPLTHLAISREFQKLDVLRKLALSSENSAENIECYRFASDLFDVRILSVVPGISQQYFRKAIDSWDVLNDNATHQLLVNFILPKGASA